MSEFFDIFSVVRYDLYIQKLVYFSTWDFRVRCSSLRCRRSIVAYKCSRPSWLGNHFLLLFSRIRVNVRPFSVSFSFHYHCSVYSFPYLTMSHNANKATVAHAVPLARVEDISKNMDSNALSGTQIVDIEIDRGVPSWSVAKYDTLCGHFRRLAVRCDFFGWHQLDYVRPSERTSRYRYWCVGAAVDAFLEMLPWHAVGCIPVGYDVSSIRSRGKLPSSFTTPCSER